MPMRKLKLNEYGRVLYFNAGVDISQATEYTLQFTKPDGATTYEVGALGLVDITGKNIECEAVTYLAGQYAEFTIPEGLLDVAGRWSYVLHAPTPSVSVPSACGSFQVTC